MGKLFDVGYTARGFEVIDRQCVGDHEPKRLVQQSSAIDSSIPGAIDKPGSSMLWVGAHHLSRDEVAALVVHLKQWLTSGSLAVQSPAPAASQHEGEE